MSQTWELRCDNKHRWQVVTEGEREPSGAEGISPSDGSKAVTATILTRVDRVEIVILPAATAVGGSREATRDGDQFRLQIRSADGWVATSARTFTWQEVVRRASLFKDATTDDARRQWARMGLGETT